MVVTQRSRRLLSRGAHPREEEHDGVQHHGQHVVARALDVEPYLRGRRLGLGVELLGLLLGGDLVLRP
jgi:hypothetical protein